MTNGYRDHPRAIEFFAGIGLVRMALEKGGCRVVFANDNSRTKRDLYIANFDPSPFICCDIRDLHGVDIPDAEITTASFPCTNISLAGQRAGLKGQDSNILWEFLRVLAEMDNRKPLVVMLENVGGFASSNGGKDLHDTVAALNELGYACDILSLDARHFVPQSRPRVFIVGSLLQLGPSNDWTPTQYRPGWIARFVAKYPELSMQAAELPRLPVNDGTLSDIAEPLASTNKLWWDVRRLGNFLSSLSDLQSGRLESLWVSKRIHRATAYRRTRNGRPVWEIRPDEISGCLRTARGGSSKQALVEAGRGNVRVRWMTAREYARLQGAQDYDFNGASESQGKYAMGDAVCVPVVAWLTKNYLSPLVRGEWSPVPIQKELVHA